MEITLKKPQIEFIGSCEQFPAYIGGVGTGKSTALIAKALFLFWQKLSIFHRISFLTLFLEGLLYYRYRDDELDVWYILVF